MLTTFNHHNHDNGWIITSPNCKDTAHCFACLIEMLENATISLVQRQVSLGLLNSLVDEIPETQKLLQSNIAMCCKVVRVITEFYSDDLYRQTSAMLCVGIIHGSQDPIVFESFINRFIEIILDRYTENTLHFCIVVFGKLCDLSVVYSKMLVFIHFHTIANLLEYCKFMEENTVSSLTYLLVHVLQVLKGDFSERSEEHNLVLMTILHLLVTWLNTAHTQDFQLNCLALLKTYLKYRETTEELVIICQDEQMILSLLMGLKRALTTKNEAIVMTGVQCLTKIMQNLTEPQLIKKVLDTDLAEFIFEFLHTTNVSQLDQVFYLLHIMADHQLFFDKCHAVYGLDSTLLAIKEALNSRKTVILEKGLIFLTCLLERQPSCIPLFVNQSWIRCYQLLLESLQMEKYSLYLIILKAIHAFLRPQHQQTPVNMMCIISILKTVIAQLEQYIKSQAISSNDEQTVNVISCNLDISVAVYGLFHINTLHVGIEEEMIQELKMLSGILCSKFIIPWIIDHCYCLKDHLLFEKFLLSLEMHLSLDSTGSIADSSQIVASGFVIKMLSLMSEASMPEDLRRMGSHVVTCIYLQLASCLKPGILINRNALLEGFLKIQFVTEQVTEAADRITSRHEVMAWLCLLYFSYLSGFRVCPVLDLRRFLDRVFYLYPDLVSYETIVTRAFVYLKALCQISCLDDDTDENDRLCLFMPLDEPEYLESIENTQTEDQVLMYLQGTAVEDWLTYDPILFRWTLLTEERILSLGISLIEYWLLHLNVPYEAGFKITDLKDEDQNILLQLEKSFSFLHCLVVLLSSQSVAASARHVLVYCITSLPNAYSDSSLKHLFDNLFIKVTQKFEAVCLYKTEFSDHLAFNLLPVMCTFMECSLWSEELSTSCLKSLYHVLKLISQNSDEKEHIVWILKYLCNVTSVLSSNDSKTVIPPMLQNERLIGVLEDYLSHSDKDISATVMSIVAWFAFNGQQFQVHRPVYVNSRVLFSSLTTSNPASCLPVLKLLHAALCAMCYEDSCVGAVKFVTRLPSFTSAQVFSTTELKGMYVYLQQCVIQKQASIRRESVDCITKLFVANPTINQYALFHSWNSLMLESVLSSRTHFGLTDAEMDLCLLFSAENSKVWTRDGVKNYLTALLKTNLTTTQHDKALRFIQQFNESESIVDQDLLARSEKYITDLQISGT